MGDPVAATDPNGDTLTYTFETGTDASFFTIDRGTGQVRVGSTPPDYEDTNQFGPGVHGSKSRPRTRRTSSTEQSRDTITVTIAVTDVDEKPTLPTGWRCR